VLTALVYFWHVDGIEDLDCDEWLHNCVVGGSNIRDACFATKDFAKGNTRPALLLIFKEPKEPQLHRPETRHPAPS